jgi:flagellar motor switch protein FliN/FliY
MSTATASPQQHQEAAEAYARALFHGCAAALSTLLNRSVAIEVDLPLRSPTDPLSSLLALPWFVADARFTRGLSGAHEILLSHNDALTLARLILGEESTDPGVVTSDHEDALREMVNQMLSSASSSLKVFFGKPVGLQFAELRQVEAADGFAPHAVAIAIGHLTVDGVPRAKMALTIPASARDEAVQAAGAAVEVGPDASAKTAPGLEMILDISMPVTVELGRTRMLIRDILALGPGSVIELDKLAGEPVDLLVNDRPIAKGEVVVIDENFGVRLTQISHATDRLRSLA